MLSSVLFRVVSESLNRVYLKGSSYSREMLMGVLLVHAALSVRGIFK